MSAEQAQPQPLRRERNLILALLILFAVAAWAVLIWQQLALAGSAEQPTFAALPRIRLAEPFEQLRRSNRATPTKINGNGGSGRRY